MIEDRIIERLREIGMISHGVFYMSEKDLDMLKREFYLIINDIKCVHCGSESIRKHGLVGVGEFSKKKIQVFYCKDCERKFNYNKLERMNHRPEAINGVVKLMKNGYNRRQTMKIINLLYNTNFSYTTLHKWIKKDKEK